MKTKANTKNIRFMEYTETLLMAQYGVANIIEHPAERGTVREEFLMDVVAKFFDGEHQFQKGVLYVDADTHDQQEDILVKKRNAIVHRYSKNVMGINPEDAHLIIEVKSTAEKTHLKELNDKIEKIQRQCPGDRPYVGMFCYKMDFAKKNLLKWFGYRYDGAGMMYVQDVSLILEYPFIDFFICIDRNNKGVSANQVFIKKNNTTNGTYILSYTYPLMDDFVQMLQGILGKNV